MTLDQIRTAAAMMIEGFDDALIAMRLGIPTSRLRIHMNAIRFEVALRRAGIVNIQQPEQVA